MMLVMENVSFERNDKILFSNINCELSPGDLMQVTGQNGSGKTTLLRILSGLIEPHQGRILWNKKNIFQSEDFQQHVHYVGHQNAIKPYLTVQENLQLICSIQGGDHKKIEEILSKFDLDRFANTIALHLSAGQKRRLALARLLLVRKLFWILDEPAAGLDAEGQTFLNEKIEEHRKQGGIAIIAKHGLSSSGDALYPLDQVIHPAAILLNDRLPDDAIASNPLSLLSLCKYDMRATLRQSFSWLTPVIFFIMVSCLFPLTAGTSAQMLKQIAPAIIWITALLSVLISLSQLFHNDFQEGYLDLLLLSSPFFSITILLKIAAFWFLHCLPLILLVPVIGTILNLTLNAEINLMMTMLLGTPVICLLGAIGSALTMGIANNSILLPIIIMPLYIPVLIFGTSGIFSMLAALFLLSLAFAPLFASFALRIGVNQ